MENTIIEDKLQIMAEDNTAITALKSLFNKKINEHMPTVNDETDNEIIGEQYRAYDQTKNIINETFMALEDYKSLNKSKNFNKER